MLPPIATVVTATSPVMLMPLRTRLKISLPKLSVPIICENDGDENFSAPFIAFGSYGVCIRPMSIKITNTAVMAEPAMKYAFVFFDFLLNPFFTLFLCCPSDMLFDIYFFINFTVLPLLGQCTCTECPPQNIQLQLQKQYTA